MNKLTIELNGSKLCYYSVGKQKNVILFIHGNSLSSDTFTKQLNDKALATNYRLIAIDMLGYGDSSRATQPETDYTFSAQAQLITNFIEKLQLTDLILVGHSLGGNIAIEVARQLNVVKGIALLGSPIAEKPMSPEMFLPNPVIPFFFNPELSSDDIESLARALYKEGSVVPDWTLEVVKKADPLTRAFVLAPVMAGNFDDQLVALKDLNIPVAVFHGEQDNLVNLSYMEKCSLPSQWEAKVNCISDGGHMFFYENAKDFNPELLRFAALL